jgi:hypothetical protein
LPSASELSVSDYQALGFTVVHSIRSSPNLILRNEDWFFEMICGLCASWGDGWYPVFFDLNFDGNCSFFLSESFELPRFGIWASLFTRLILPIVIHPPFKDSVRLPRHLSSVSDAFV